jgi:hypothetical protein
MTDRLQHRPVWVAAVRPMILKPGISLAGDLAMRYGFIISRNDDSDAFRFSLLLAFRPQVLSVCRALRDHQPIFLCRQVL